MNLVTLEHIAKQFSERVLLDDVDLRLNTGDRIGLIGINGSGKTTLLRIVAGIERPDAGTVTVWGGVRVAYLPQEPVLDPAHTVLEAVYAGDAPLLSLLRDYHAATVALGAAPDEAAGQARLSRLAAELDRTSGWAAEAEAKAVLHRLGITDVDARVGTLSGGQQKRVALAKALIDPADLLVLDEPTNHVDAETIAWLEQYLLRSPRALLMVTHDRYFLDRVANRILELDRRQLVSYPGSYRHYLEQRSQRHERLAKMEDTRRGQLRRELEWLRRGAKARSTKQKARIQRVEEMQQIQYDSGEDRVALALAGRRLGKQVLAATGIGKAFDGRTVLSGIDLSLGPGDRIGIIGPNGAGKSTLLDILAGVLEASEGDIKWGETVAVGYFDQRSAALRDDMKVIDYIDQEAPVIRMADGSQVTSSRMLEWLLFPGPQQHAQIGSLSGGERRRLYLLRTLIHRPNVLLLDEPTNDLDIETLGVLESFLDTFTGTVIVVSHDRYFLDRVVDQLAVLEDGRLHAGYPTPFETFLRMRGEQRAAATPTALPTSKARANQVTAVVTGTVRKRTWKESRELEDLEARIADLETRQHALTTEIATAGSDFTRLQALTDDLAAVGATLDAATERWLALSEMAG
ncbi:MAG: ABC-F family ATP-binding cassette domain-containing protein [Ardenticatenales bacterium]|nr:ABC-F family ATP-binding cassette domain-containing protein [Ardenticatenales bacterium]